MWAPNGAGIRRHLPLMRAARVRRIRARFAVEPTAMKDVYEYVSRSAYPRDIGLAFGDLARFGREIVTTDLTLREAAEILRVLGRDRKLRQRVRRALERQTGKRMSEKLAALLGGVNVQNV